MLHVEQHGTCNPAQPKAATLPLDGRFKAGHGETFGARPRNRYYDRGGEGVMRGKSRLLIFAAVMLWIFARTAMTAFAMPWTWNSDQALLAWLAICPALVLSIWVTAWLRGGNEALQVRWKRMLEQSAARMDGKIFWRNLWLWIGVAVVLAFIYNLTQH